MCSESSSKWNGGHVVHDDFKRGGGIAELFRFTVGRDEASSQEFMPFDDCVEGSC